MGRRRKAEPEPITQEQYDYDLACAARDAYEAGKREGSARAAFWILVGVPALYLPIFLAGDYWWVVAGIEGGIYALCRWLKTNKGKRVWTALRRMGNTAEPQVSPAMQAYLRAESEKLRVQLDRIEEQRRGSTETGK
jgi:hypothetical protein